MEENELSKILRLRAIEYLFIIIFLTICAIVIGKYVFMFYTNEDILVNVDRMILHYMNIHGSNSSIAKTTKNFSLKKEENGNWSLYSAENKSTEYIIESLDGKISFKRNFSDQNRTPIDIEIENSGDYYSRSDQIETDIPYIYEANKTYDIAEQEDLFPIIGYHNEFTNEEDIVDPYIDMRVEDFEDQLKFYNTDLNCRWLTLGYVTENYISQKKKLPRNTCVMTFDDGRKNNITNVAPLLDKYGVKSTFFIIAGRTDQRSYMNNWEISELFRAGHEIGSHTLTGGSLIDTSWYTKGPFTKEVLWDQLYNSKATLNTYGYNTKLFAYPLGDYNDDILNTIKQAGYQAARTSKKTSTWRDPRALAISMDDKFLWELNYYEPVLKFNNEIKKDIGYNGWWQFEEGSAITDTGKTKVNIKSQDIPTDSSYGVVSLEDPGDAIKSAFLIDNDGQYEIDMLASLMNKSTSNIKFAIDGTSVNLENDKNSPCTKSVNLDYCIYKASVTLNSGYHNLEIVNGNFQSRLDKYKIIRKVVQQEAYNVSITEYKN